MKLFLPVAMLVAFAFGGPAMSQPTCDIYANIKADLDKKYGEARLGVGRGALHLFELWASAETGTWTILEVFPGGMACVRAAGEGWTVDPPVPPGEPA